MCVNQTVPEPGQKNTKFIIYLHRTKSASMLSLTDRGFQWPCDISNPTLKSSQHPLFQHFGRPYLLLASLGVMAKSFLVPPVLQWPMQCSGLASSQKEEPVADTHFILKQKTISGYHRAESPAWVQIPNHRIQFLLFYCFSFISSE